MDWELIITGCGTSHGNPPWGIPELWSTDPRDHRRRSGAILRGPAGEVVLIDAGPDLMHQLRDPYKTWNGRDYPENCITRCDAVLITHTHADHSHGLNELRHLNRLMAMCGIQIFGHGPHLSELVSMFGYCFRAPHAAYQMGSPSLEAVPVADEELFPCAGLSVLPLAASHGPAGRVTAYRIGGLAYLTDIKDLPLSADRFLHHLDLLVLNMLHEALHPTHCNWDEAQAIIARLKPRRCVLTHMGHTVHYQDWEERLPAGVDMAYDGWRASFSP